MYIEENEVLRYLGVSPKRANSDLRVYVYDCIEEILKVAYPKYVYNILDLEINEGNILLKGTDIYLEGENINKHLDNCFKCALMGVTIGALVDRKIEYYKNYDLTRSFVLDACATALVESICDEVQEEISSIAKKEYKLKITSRYSPGYGDFSLNIQSKLLNVLKADKIGLTVTEEMIMIPRKSVTAIIGLKEQKESFEISCKNCSSKNNCIYKKDG